jgi:broad specificity phosphatase PhoE
MTELWLVRHGQTDWNVSGRYQGQTDIPLNSTGLAQARVQAAVLAGLQLAPWRGLRFAPWRGSSNGHQRPNFSAIYSSDLSRAYQTAQIVAEALGLKVQKHPGLREVGLGDWEGQTRDIVHARYPDLIIARETNMLDFPPPGGETNRQAARRVASVANEIAHAYPAGRVLVVSHGITVAALICQANGFPLEDIYHNVPDNAQPMVVEWKPTQPSVG